MKSQSFHYKINFNGDSFKTRYDSAKHRVNGFSTKEQAITAGKTKLTKLGFNPLMNEVVAYDPMEKQTVQTPKLTGFEARRKAIELGDIRTRLDELSAQYTKSFGFDDNSKQLFNILTDMHSKEIALKEIYESNN